jgi:hypothetical protein
MEVSDVRRRLLTAIDEARRQAAERRARKDEAVRAWEGALADVAVPVFHQVSQALAAEGFRFQVVTPGTTVRLVAERGGEEFIEVALDTDGDEPMVMIRSTQGRGRRTVTRERPLVAGAAVGGLTDAEIVDAVIVELKPFLAR